MTVLVEGMPSAWLQQTGAARAEQQRRACFFLRIFHLAVEYNAFREDLR
jgi:hypothetical protein